MEVGLDRIKLKSGILGAEPWSEEMRATIEKKLGISAIDIYGLSEMVGPGVSIECQEKNGAHIFEDAFIAEIIDSETGEVLPPGEAGELVLTNINKEGLSLLRYRTRDLTRLDYELCPCGRTPRTHAPRQGPFRRHADHPRRQRLPRPRSRWC